MTGTLRTLHDELSESIAEGVANEETISQITDRIRERFNIAGRRAATIARTEVASAVEEAQHAGRVQAKVPMKSWLHSRRETGRPGHAAAERHYMADPIAVSEMFDIADAKGIARSCLYPRDTRLPAGEIINCGCTTISRYPDDDVKDARLLQHLLVRGFVTLDAMTA